MSAESIDVKLKLIAELLKQVADEADQEGVDFRLTIGRPDNTFDFDYTNGKVYGDDQTGIFSPGTWVGSSYGC